ncbi:hypothetical protein [Cognatiluteimonas telluris]|uniref:hypothetical protein n=1 Tax=Cognatiluteimonas telluris TaxID=1104775 RepID=UPI00140A9ADC|nr:hypothetical protein [Lysobacter telluris]
MTPRLPVAAATLALALAGCTTTSRVMLGPTYPALAPGQVHIYYQPPTRYREVALLETQSGSFIYGEQNKMNSVLTKLRAEAAKLGANGVLFQGTENEYRGGGVGVGVGGGTFGGHSHFGVGVGIDINPTPKHARGMAIYVTDPTPAATPAPPSP